MKIARLLRDAGRVIVNYRQSSADRCRRSIGGAASCGSLAGFRTATTDPDARISTFLDVTKWLVLVEQI